MPTLYALLVGINEYQAVTKLAGCVADIQSVEALLRERVTAESLELRRLLDGEATRANIIDGFRSHLTRAGGDDVALFYYCGHGSQEPCPEEWRALEPSGKNQTLLPVDARVGDVFEIADKELTVLIDEVAAGGAHVVTIFDSCHSGGVTRDVEDEATGGVARMAPSAKGRTRTLDDYLAEARLAHAPDRIATQGPPAPRHVAIAACQHFETAKEFPVKPPRRGAFTAAFEEAVRALGPTATYSDLVSAVRVKVRDRAREQLPNLYVSGGARGSDRFLGGQAGRADLTVDVDATGRWWLSAGAIDGIPTPASGDVAQVAIHPRGAFEGDGAAPAPIATATVDLVLDDRARLQLPEGVTALDPARQYLGVITRLGTPALHVLVEGEPAEAVERVRVQLSKAGVQYAVVTRRTHVPAVTVRVSGEQAQLVAEDGSAIDGRDYPTGDGAMEALAASCTHLARWYGLRDRAPTASRYNERVTIEVIPVVGTEKRPPADRQPLAPRDGVVQLPYEGSNPPRVQLRFQNTTNDRLFVCLLDLDDAFGSSTLFADWIPAGKTGFAAGEKAFRMKIPEWRDPSVTTATDWFKLFASTAQFDTDHLQLAALAGPQARAAELVDDAEEEDDSTWGTTRLKVVVSR